MSSVEQTSLCPFCQQAFVVVGPAGAVQTVACPHCRQPLAVAIATATPAASQPQQATAPTGARQGPSSTGNLTTVAPYLAPWEVLTPQSPSPLESIPVAADLPVAQSESSDTEAAPGEQRGFRISVPELFMRLVNLASNPSVLWVAAVAGVLVVAGGVFLAGSRWIGRPSPRSVPDRTVASHPIHSVKPADNAPSSITGHWTDATRSSLKLGVFEVAVKRAELGPVLGRDEGRRPITVVDLALIVQLEVRNRSEDIAEYVSWYARAIQGEEAVGVDLMDNMGRHYPLVAVPSALDVKGHVARAELEPAQRVNDVLIFHLPPDLDRKSVSDFHLWLDFATQGGEGELRFTFPASWVRNW